MGVRVLIGVSFSAVLALSGCSASEPDAITMRQQTVRPSQAGTNVPVSSTATAGTAAGGGAGTGSSLGGLSMPVPIMGLAGSGAPGAPGTMMPDTTCASALVDTSPVTPVIWLVVDGSSSMLDPFEAGRDRWTALRSTLMDPGGVVDSLQTVAKFGLVIYSGGGGLDPNSCVKLVTVQPALNNHAAISAQYPMLPIGMGTPTDKALDYVVTNLPVGNMAMLDARMDPNYVILATDGSPNDMCGDPLGGLIGGLAGGDVRQRVIDVVAKGTQAGMQMYVVSMAGGDPQLQSHLEQVAMATESKTPPFVPASQKDLVATIQRIVGGASCQIDLKGMVEKGQECKGRVMLNDKELPCNNDNGWRLIDPGKFALTGTACEMFGRTASTLRAQFPCEIFTPE